MNYRKARSSLIAAAVVVTLALGLNAQSALADSSARSLLGSWKGTVTATFPPGLGPPFTSLITFSPGGGVVESRRLLVPVTPFGALIETTGHGQWVARKKCEVAVEFVFLLQRLDNGEMAGTDTVHLDLRLETGDGGERQLNGVFQSIIRDVDGTAIFEASGTYLATPILVHAASGHGDETDDADDCPHE